MLYCSEYNCSSISLNLLIKCKKIKNRPKTLLHTYFENGNTMHLVVYLKFDKLYSVVRLKKGPVGRLFSFVINFRNKSEVH